MEDPAKKNLREKLAQKIHPWWNANFFQPLQRVQKAAGQLGLGPLPIEECLWEARAFAKRLWECCDDEEMSLIVCDDQRGAARFCSFGAEVAIQAALKNPGPIKFIEPKAGKPFAGVAGFFLWMLDMIESQTPGKTTPPKQ